MAKPKKPDPAPSGKKPVVAKAPVEIAAPVEHPLTAALRRVEAANQKVLSCRSDLEKAEARNAEEHGKLGPSDYDLLRSGADNVEVRKVQKVLEDSIKGVQNAQAALSLAELELDVAQDKAAEEQGRLSPEDADRLRCVRDGETHKSSLSRPARSSVTVGRSRRCAATANCSSRRSRSERPSVGPSASDHQRRGGPLGPRHRRPGPVGRPLDQD